MTFVIFYFISVVPVLLYFVHVVYIAFDSEAYRRQYKFVIIFGLLCLLSLLDNEQKKKKKVVNFDLRP